MTADVEYAALMEACAVRLAERFHTSRDEFRGYLYEMLDVCRRSWKPDGGATFETYYYAAVMRSAYDDVVVPDCEAHVRRRRLARGRRPDRVLAYLSRLARRARQASDPLPLGDVWGPLLKPLDAEQREVVVMHFAEGRNFREIGDAKGYSRQRAQQLVSSALRRIRDRGTSLRRRVVG